MKYISTKFAPDLLGKTPELADEVVSLTDKLKSINDKLILRCYSKKKFEEVDALEYMAPVIDILGDHEFFAGPELTYVDFFMLELCEFSQYLSQGELYKEHQNIAKYVTKMKNYPNIKRYLESGRLEGLKFTNKNAKI